MNLGGNGEVVSRSFRFLSGSCGFQRQPELTLLTALEHDQLVRHLAQGEVHARAVFACLFMRKVVLLVAMPQKFFSLSGSRIFLWKYM